MHFLSILGHLLCSVVIQGFLIKKNPIILKEILQPQLSSPPGIRIQGDGGGGAQPSATCILNIALGVINRPGLAGAVL